MSERRAKTRTVNGQEVAVHRNDGFRKRCDCARRAWPKCPHPWHFNFKARGEGQHHHRFPLDRYAAQPITTREEARAETDRLRSLIRTGVFPPVPPSAVKAASDITFTAFTTLWRERARADMAPEQKVNDASICKQLGAQVINGVPLGDMAIGRITESDREEAFTGFGHLANATVNKYRQAVLHLQRWGRKKGYLTSVWASDDAIEKGGTLAHKQGSRRHRRLLPDTLDAQGQVVTPGEERQLLTVASPWFYRLIVAALDTCCRRGELLSLTWGDVSLSRNELRIRPEHAKSGVGRVIPLSPRMVAVLTLVRNDPAGQPHPPSAYVFGNAIGKAVSSPKKAWETLVLKSHGHTPVWQGSRLSPETRAQYRAANLHFHDLRHEGASRLLEQGWPLHHVQAMLGHSDAKTTSIYLNATAVELHASMRRFGQSLHPVAHEAESTTAPVCNSDEPVAVTVTVN